MNRDQIIAATDDLIGRNSELHNEALRCTDADRILAIRTEQHRIGAELQALENCWRWQCAGTTAVEARP